jgi:hypothetical protein
LIRLAGPAAEASLVTSEEVGEEGGDEDGLQETRVGTVGGIETLTGIDIVTEVANVTVTVIANATANGETRIGPDDHQLVERGHRIETSGTVRETVL